MRPFRYNRSMEIAIFADIHDNEVRLKEALEIIKAEKIKIGICCGDISRLETLEMAAKPFQKLYVAFGNMDYTLKGQTELFPKNVIFSEKVLEINLAKRSIALTHNSRTARELAREGKYDLVFYGHDHTPWEKRVGRTILLNPGEVSGQFGPASFATFDLSTMKAKLKLIK